MSAYLDSISLSGLEGCKKYLLLHFPRLFTQLMENRRSDSLLFTQLVTLAFGCNALYTNFGVSSDISNSVVKEATIVARQYLCDIRKLPRSGTILYSYSTRMPTCWLTDSRFFDYDDLFFDHYKTVRDDDNYKRNIVVLYFSLLTRISRRICNIDNARPSIPSRINFHPITLNEFNYAAKHYYDAKPRFQLVFIGLLVTKACCKKITCLSTFCSESHTVRIESVDIPIETAFTLASNVLRRAYEFVL